jgi:hypothetical protein
MMARKQLRQTGAVVQELAFNPICFLDEMKKTGIELKITDAQHKNSWIGSG